MLQESVYNRCICSPGQCRQVHWRLCRRSMSCKNTVCASFYRAGWVAHAHTLKHKNIHVSMVTEFGRHQSHSDTQSRPSIPSSNNSYRHGCWKLGQTITTAGSSSSSMLLYPSPLPHFPSTTTQAWTAVNLFEWVISPPFPYPTTERTGSTLHHLYTSFSFHRLVCHFLPSPPRLTSRSPKADTKRATSFCLRNTDQSCTAVTVLACYWPRRRTLVAWWPRAESAVCLSMCCDEEKRTVLRPRALTNTEKPTANSLSSLYEKRTLRAWSSYPSVSNCSVVWVVVRFCFALGFIFIRYIHTCIVSCECGFCFLWDYFYHGTTFFWFLYKKVTHFLFLLNTTLFLFFLVSLWYLFLLLRFVVLRCTVTGCVK